MERFQKCGHVCMCTCSRVCVYGCMCVCLIAVKLPVYMSLSHTSSHCATKHHLFLQLFEQYRVSVVKTKT